MKGFPFTLVEASPGAHGVDVTFFILLAVAGTILVGLTLLVIVFAARYRRDSHAPRGPLPKLLRREMEIGWTVTTAFLAIFLFWWFVGGMYFPSRVLPHQMEIHVVAKQWMWKTEQPNGVREINALHLPLGTPVRLVMTSQDVIHSFFLPAFREKQDVLPGTVTELEFTPTVAGTFHLFCAEYCGVQHSRMTGELVVLTAPQYAAWLARQPRGDTLAAQGGALYGRFGCGTCHADGSRVPAPKLEGVAGSLVRLATGAQVRADDAYLRRAILQPKADIVAGYAPIMPSYAATADAGQVDALLAYIKSLPKARP